MSRTRGIHLAALPNLDRLLVKSMLGILARHLKSRWYDTEAGAIAVLADADSAEGFKVLEDAKRRGLATIGLTSRPLTPWQHLLQRPAQSKDLMLILDRIDDLYSQAESERINASVRQTGLNAAVSAPMQAKKAANLFDYFTDSHPDGIVEIRFGPGRTLMCNHNTSEFASAISLNVLRQQGVAPIQITQHGVGQAVNEWRMASRMLPVGSLEELCWHVVFDHSHGKPLAKLPSLVSLHRLPRVSEAFNTPTQAVAKLVSRSANDLNGIVRATGVSRETVINFINAAMACGLVLGAQPVRPSWAPATVMAAIARL